MTRAEHLECLDTLRRILELEEDWDSYGAPQIDLGAAGLAIFLLSKHLRENTPKPHIGPSSAGGVTIEWHTKNVEIEMCCENSQEVSVLFESQGVEMEAEYKIHELYRLAPMIEHLE